VLGKIPCNGLGWSSALVPVMVILQKKIKTSLGSSEIEVSRDRKASFNPMLIPKRSNVIDSIENVIISLYLKRMSNLEIKNMEDYFICW